MHYRVSALFSCPLLVFPSHCFALKVETPSLPSSWLSVCYFMASVRKRFEQEIWWVKFSLFFRLLRIMTCQTGHYAINKRQPLVWFLFICPSVRELSLGSV